MPRAALRGSVGAMTDGRDPPQAAEPEQSAAEVATALRRATRLLRVLAPVMAELADFQDALALVQRSMAGITADTAPSPPGPAPAPAAASAPAAAVPAVRPAPAGDAAAAPPDPQPVPLHPETRASVSVFVSRGDGPVDLVQVHHALAGLPHLGELTVASYTREQAELRLRADRAPRELQINEVLAAAFPEGVTGRWTGPAEYRARIGGGPAGGPLPDAARPVAEDDRMPPARRWRLR